ncbi:unnamed protein product [Prorocentrum cordatum]|uniref:Uncharacterized protein n=1 Tax=Prorocentrum cordatum TaxID=2364126 RepID=A0ABN9SFA3_9DINO|nr:unnamed protein product [Polarella glacialis]
MLVSLVALIVTPGVDMHFAKLSENVASRRGTKTAINIKTRRSAHRALGAAPEAPPGNPSADPRNPHGRPHLYGYDIVCSPVRSLTTLGPPAAACADAEVEANACARAPPLISACAKAG